MHEVLVNRLGGLSLPGKSVVGLTDCPDMTLDVYHGRKTTTQHNNSRLRCRQKSQPKGKQIMAETRFTKFPALFVDQRVGIYMSTSETDD